MWSSFDLDETSQNNETLTLKVLQQFMSESGFLSDKFELESN